MKKIVKYFMMVIALCIFALTANSFSMAEASALYTPASYWNNDTNYPLAFSQNGVNRYVDLSSAKIIEQEEKVEENTKTAVFSYDVVMVDGDKTTKFTYKTMIRFINDEIYNNENDNSIVMLVEINNYKFLFMGDAGKEVEKDILDKYRR